jgi:hypothetical protein
MIFSKKFMTDMNEILGLQDWGQYFCEPSLAWYDQVHGDAELPYYEGLQSIRIHPDIPEDDRPFWVKTVKLLQSNIEAIKYGDRYTVDGYKIIGPEINEEFEDFKGVIVTFTDLVKSYYTVGNYFKIAQVTTNDTGTYITSISNLSDIINPYTKLRVYSKSGKESTIDMCDLDSYIAKEMDLEKKSSLCPYRLYKKIKDIDDGFTVLEKVNV